MKARIVPSILVSNKAELILRINALNGLTKMAQLDVLDGSFVPEVSFFDPQVISDLKPEFELEVHLMVKDAAGRSGEFKYPWVKRIYFHHEAVENALDMAKNIRSLDKEVGIALNPGTSIEQIKEVLPHIDAVLVMSVYPGKNGQEFISDSLGKIRELRSMSKKLLIEVDGGLNKTNIKKCLQAGADLLVVGSAIRNHSVKTDLDSLSEVL